MDGGREGTPGEPIGSWSSSSVKCAEMRGRPLAGGERGWRLEGSEVWGTGKGWRQRGDVVLMLMRKSTAEPGAGAGGKFLLVGKTESKTEAGDTLGTGARFFSALSSLPGIHSWPL